ncbi:autotransporter outer membrane beta-barrel domain-containing protein, partial [Ruegeria sp. SCP11]|uniref:autotransporter outer membrane beta-barrel domain-containing protein n=1 Tax=Ruegeria sp. SCP11 TaxID=3141378 RepID=UPI00333B9B60
MTKYKGHVASFAPALGRIPSGVSAAALGATTLLPTSSALAGSCVPQVPGIFLCSGPADPINDISVTIINGAPIFVETALGFGIEPFNSANAIDLFSNSGVTFTDNNGSTVLSRTNDALRTVVYGGGDLTVTTTGTLSGARNGIYARNYGVFSPGSLSITAADISGASDDGIYARNDRGTDLSITTSGIVTGGRSGIVARHSGSGALTISTASVSGGATGDGIYATSSGGDLSISTTDRVIGGNRGIAAINNGSGALTISTADVTGTNSFGIRAANYGSGTDLSVTASGTVTGGRDAISASNRGTGNMTIDVGDAISTTDGYGINARNYGAGALVISAANVTGTANNSGIYAGNTGTDLSITTSGLVTSNWRGISARNTGTGDLTVSTADVTSTRLNGLNLANYGANLSVTSTGTISAVTKGIDARNQGTGALTVSVNNVTGTNEEGMYLLNAASGTDLSITAAGTVTGATGIAATNRGSGALTISTSDVTGTVGNGVIARNEGGTDLSVNTQGGTVTSGDDGIVALNDGSGALTISSAVVTTTGRNGIFALNRTLGTDLSIANTGTVTGTYTGVTAINQGSGALTIATGGAIGTNGIGVYARNEGNGDLTISTSGVVSGDFRGIYARNFGDGALRVNVGGTVTAGASAAIDVRTNSGGSSVITLESGASVSSLSGEAIVDGDGGNSHVILRSGSAIAGEVLLSDGTDALTIEGGANISAATLFDGGLGTQDTLTFSAFNGNLDGALFTNWENLTADNGSVLTLDSSASNINSLAANNGSTIAAGEADQSLNSNLRTDATSRFLAGFGGSGTVSVVGEVNNDGLISLADGSGGDRLTIGGDLTGSGTVALDVDFDAGTNDQLIVTGDSSGAQQGLQVQKSGTLANLQTYALATISDSSSANDFRLVNGDFVTKGGEGAIVGGAYTFLLDYDPATGEFILSPFAENGGVYLNPNRAFLAAGIQQFSDHMALDGALRRLIGRTGAEDANTVSRSLSELSSTDQPLVWLNAEGGRDRYTSGDRTNETTSGGLRVGASLPLAEIGGGALIGGLEFGATTLSTDSETSLADGKIDTDAYDVTLSALWLADSQLYLDGQLRYAFFDST